MRKYTPEQRAFLRHLRKTAAIVAKWPKWKREAQGGKMAEWQDRPTTPTRS